MKNRMTLEARGEFAYRILPYLGLILPKNPDIADEFGTNGHYAFEIIVSSIREAMGQALGDKIPSYLLACGNAVPDELPFTLESIVRIAVDRIAYVSIQVGIHKRISMGMRSEVPLREVGISEVEFDMFLFEIIYETIYDVTNALAPQVLSK